MPNFLPRLVLLGSILGVEDGLHARQAHKDEALLLRISPGENFRLFLFSFVSHKRRFRERVAKESRASPRRRTTFLSPENLFSLGKKFLMEDEWIFAEASAETAALLRRYRRPLVAVRVPKREAHAVRNLLVDRRYLLGRGRTHEEATVDFVLNPAGAEKLAVEENFECILHLSREARFVSGRRYIRAPAAPPMREGRRFRFCELFAGIGGFRVALDQLGGQCVFASEQCSEARKTYRANFGEDELDVAGDIELVDEASIPDFDVLTAGFPCQSFTTAGSQRGLEGSALFFSIVRVLESKQPAGFILENVPNLVRIGHTIEIIVAALCQASYHVSYRVLDGGKLLAQRRKRLFIVGVRNDLVRGRSFPWPLLEDLGLVFRDVEQEECDLDMEALVLSEKQRRTIREVPIIDPSSKSRTIMASYRSSFRLSSQFCRVADGSLRFLSAREVARLQGFPDSFQLNALGDKVRIYSQLGNAVPPPLVIEVGKVLLQILGFA